MARHAVLIVSTGTANMASIRIGLERQGAEVTVAQNPAQILEAQRVVLPGVGALGAAMKKLVREGFVHAIRERVASGKPTLAICLGFQLLCEGSEESPGIPGIGAISGRAERFAETVRVPQIGWNRVNPSQGSVLLAPGYAYFANSFRLEKAPPGWAYATSSYGGIFIAALEKGGLLCCQFHPELSGAYGQTLLRRWLQLPPSKGGG